MQGIREKRRYLWGFAGLAMSVIWLSWLFIPRNAVALTRDLANVLNVLRDNRVTAYVDQDWCRYLVTTDRMYADPPTNPSVACKTNGDPSVPFDKKSRALFEEVRRATKAANLDIVAIEVDDGKDGAIEYAELSERQLFGRDAYMYQSDDDPPEIPKGRVTRVGRAWFHYQGD